ncbi:unnamed protein product [Amoebophrya sp. A120]|nr:unnamed protein product [Amoebophrya sp. A120]|eukprot:GSA120T00024241001.1
MTSSAGASSSSGGSTSLPMPSTDSKKNSDGGAKVVPAQDDQGTKITAASSASSSSSSKRPAAELHAGGPQKIGSSTASSTSTSSSTATSSSSSTAIGAVHHVAIELQETPVTGLSANSSETAKFLDRSGSYDVVDPGTPANDSTTAASGGRGPTAQLNLLVEKLDAHARQFLPPWLHPYLNKGDVSNFATFCVMLFGLWLQVVWFETDEQREQNYILAFGLFGFAGGFTNWLAIKMLFEPVCNLPGSGVIPARFKEIRTVVKSTIMKAFFDDEFLNSYLNTRVPKLLEQFDIPSLLDKPGFETTLKQKMEEVAATPEGMMLNMIKQMFGGSFDGLMPMLKPTLAALAKDLTTNLDVGSFLSVERIKVEIDLLMTEKLELLSPDLVKRLLEEMIRKHLGWLVLWGNIFGGAIGLFSLWMQIHFDLTRR